jgi:hypothetical protein
MIRFMADTLLEAVLRPVSMALPLGGIYVEPIAPDFRFVFALLLSLAWLAVLVSARRAGAPPRAVLALLVFCAASFVPWMAFSGNGRYFIPTLLLVGPLCIAVLHHLPVSRSLRSAGAVLMLAAQAFLIHENVPWNSWTLAPWREAPAFAVDVPPDVARQPATYVMLNGISYSLVAPAFHPHSRWMSLAAQQGRPADPRDPERARRLLAQSSSIYLFLPSLPGASITGGKLPVDQAVSVQTALAPHGLRLREDTTCRMLASRGLTSVALRPDQPVPTEPEAQRGFWLCPLDVVAPADAPKPAPIDPRVEAVFERLEMQCPRMFPPGSAKSAVLRAGVRRYYSDSDTRLFVSNDGDVMYKYIRSLNAVTIGTVQDIMASGFHMDCNNIRGRSGLPWDREI